MKHFAMVLAMTAICGAGVARAQSTPAATDRAYIEVTGGPTFGHKTGGSMGAEGGYWILNSLGVFAEAGRMTNVVTKSTLDQASLIGSAIGASASAKTAATYFDAGVMYRLPAHSRLHPYAALGFGVAHATNSSTFKVGGSDITGQIANYGAQLGSDLAGSYTRPFVTFGIGTHIPFGSRWLGDISYRYGRIGAETGDNASIAAINSNRLQFGVGARF